MPSQTKLAAALAGPQLAAALTTDAEALRSRLDSMVSKGGVHTERCRECRAALEGASQTKEAVHSEGSALRIEHRLLAELHDMGVEVLDKERTWRGGCDPATLRRGDWSCPACGENCFASRSECFKCHAPKPSSSAQG